MTFERYKDDPFPDLRRWTENRLKREMRESPPPNTLPENKLKGILVAHTSSTSKDREEKG